MHKTIVPPPRFSRSNPLIRTVLATVVSALFSPVSAAVPIRSATSHLEEKKFGRRFSDLSKIAVAVSSIAISLSVNAQIIEKPEPNKQYDDFLYWDKEVQINEYPTAEKHYYFNKGAQIGGSAGGTGNAVLVGMGESDLNVTFHVGKAEDKDYDLTLIGSSSGVKVSTGAQFHIDGSQADIKFGPEKWDEYGDEASIYVDENAVFTVNAANMWTTGGAETNLKLFDNARTDIVLSGNFLSDAGGTGIAAQNFYADSNTNLTISAKNITLSTTDLPSAERRAGLYLLAYDGGGSSTLNVSLKAEKDLTISGFSRGIQTFGSTYISLTGQNITISALANENGYGLYLKGQNAEKSTNLKMQSNGNVVVSGTERAIYATDRVDIENISGNLVEVQGGEYGVCLTKNSSITTNANTLIMDADDGRSVYLGSGSSGEFRATKATYNNDVYVTDSSYEALSYLNTVNGQVKVVEGGTATFASVNEDSDGNAFIRHTGSDAVIAYSDTEENSLITFKQTAYINSQGDEDYHPEKQDKKTDAAIRANRNSQITLDSAAGVYGDVIAGRGNEDATNKGGIISITSTDDAVFKGDYLAGNGGSISLTLKGNSHFEGRVDDYNDAGKTGLDGQDMVFRPAEFDVDVSEAGTVNLTIADSTWTARHRNFVTELKFAGSDASKNYIDLSTDGNSSLIIQKLSGSGTIKMKLSQAEGSDGAHLSDMLYVGKLGQDAHINIELDTSDIESYEELTGLRFATTGGDFFSESSGASAISARIENVGFFNRNLNIYTEAYSNASAEDQAENEAYNGEDDGSTALGEAGGKPGQDYVHDMFGDDVSTNWYIGDEKSGTDGGVISEAGQTILATARATYWNAVILDRFNQRYGDRVYDQNHNGVWARVKYEHIGTDAGVGDFSSDNTTYQFGYDYTKLTENGKMIWGGAIDYMDGRTDYKSINGDGGTDRIGALLYATYLADNGAYTDLVLRAGRLSADYQMSTPSGTKLDADYDHWMYGISFEAGHQLENGTGWFLEPQLQAQYTRITDGDYRNQQTRVEQDAIDSLITRAGFRVGKLLSDNKATLGYFKADVMREWMGEQDIRVYDVTTATEGADVSLSNHGTWFDVGGGFQAAVTQNLYAYGDVEYRFGNDFDNTWIVNIGAKYRF